MLPPTAASPFYSSAAFDMPFVPLSVLYTAAAHFGCLCLRPFPNWRLKPKVVETKPITNDKVAIVTGSNTGIGFETASSLVERGYQVIVACRSRDKGMEAVDRIHSSMKNKGTGQAVFLHPLDLSSFESVRSFSNAVQERYGNIDILVNNAGRNTSGKSEQNLDLCFQTNFLGHFLLTKLLLSNLLKAKGRVVNLSSVTHHFCGTNKNSPHDESWWTQQATYDEKSAYKPSKLAAILFSMELNRRYGSKGLRSMAVNPGSVLSDIWRDYPRWLVFLFSLLYINPKKGSTTSVAAAVGEFPKEALYLQPYWLFNKNKVPFPAMEMLGPYVGYEITKPRLPNDGTEGSATAQVMWKVSEKLVGCEYDK